MATLMEDCSRHSGICESVKNLKDFRDEQKDINGEFRKEIESINKKLSVLLGGVLILWPAVQVIMWLMGKK